MKHKKDCGVASYASALTLRLEGAKLTIQRVCMLLSIKRDL